MTAKKATTKSYTVSYNLNLIVEVHVKADSMSAAAAIAEGLKYADLGIELSGSLIDYTLNGVSGIFDNSL